jgi:hypothetical protein
MQNQVGIGAFAKRAFQPAVGDLIVAGIAQIAGHEQDVGLRLHRVERAQRLIEALAVELGRIVRLEPEMDIGDLRDQHRRSVICALLRALARVWPQS